jgi:hypothetical protein
MQYKLFAVAVTYHLYETSTVLWLILFTYANWMFRY